LDCASEEDIEINRINMLINHLCKIVSISVQQKYIKMNGDILNKNQRTAYIEVIRVVKHVE
jgi:hypothetical protein